MTKMSPEAKAILAAGILGLHRWPTEKSLMFDTLMCLTALIFLEPGSCVTFWVFAIALGFAQIMHLGFFLAMRDMERDGDFVFQEPMWLKFGITKVDWKYMPANFLLDILLVAIFFTRGHEYLATVMLLSHVLGYIQQFEWRKKVSRYVWQRLLTLGPGMLEKEATE